VPEFLNVAVRSASVFVVCAAIWGTFRALEKVASPNKKVGLTKFLRSADWTIVPYRITDACRDAFEGIFGTSQFSAKCLRRSLQFSLLAMLVLFTFGFLNHYSYFRTMPDVVIHHPTYKIILFGWLIWSLVFDYFNLYKTRLLIWLIDRYKVAVFVFACLVLFDIAISFVVFVLSQNIFHSISMAAQTCPNSNGCSFSYVIQLAFSFFKIISRDPTLPMERLYLVMQGPTSNEVAVFFWSGLLPTLWLVVYVLATAVTRWLVKIADLISFTIDWLDFDRPFEMIGFVGANLVGISIVIYDLVWKIMLR
jgi:hypothetical protein